MFNRPMELSPDRRVRMETHAEALERRVDAHAAAVVEELSLDPLRDHLEHIAFTPNEALPKRAQRPTVKIEHLVEQLALAAAVDQREIDTLLRFTIGVQEYYDIFDDLVDGDVAPGHEPDAIIALQLLFPVLVEYLGELGAAARRFWTERAAALMEAPLAERLTEPDAERYAAILDRQADLFGFVSGLAPIVADRPSERVSRAERLGQLYFKHEQLLLDGEQYATGDGDPWNAVDLLGRTETLERIRTLRGDFESLASTVLPERADQVTALVAVDLDAWCDSIGLH